MKNRKVAITGGIGSGKSEVCKRLLQLGYPVYSCDKIYKDIYQTQEYQSVLEREFPQCIKDGKIDKSSLADFVFQNPDALEKLNSIAHPRIMNRLEEALACVDGIIFVEVPLLFEGGYENLFDYVIIVERSKQLRICSVMQRDGLPEEAVLRRMSSQFNYDASDAYKSLDNKKYIRLNNNEGVETLYSNIEKIVSELKM